MNQNVSLAGRPSLSLVLESWTQQPADSCDVSWLAFLLFWWWHWLLIERKCGKDSLQQRLNETGGGNAGICCKTPFTVSPQCSSLAPPANASIEKKQASVSLCRKQQLNEDIKKTFWNNLHFNRFFFTFHFKPCVFCQDFLLTPSFH